MTAPLPKLSPKRRAFVRHYTVERNASRAARLAGYSVRTCDVIGARLRKIPEIAKWIAHFDAGLQARSEITLEHIMTELALIGFANPMDFMKRVDGKWVVNTDVELDREHMAAVKKIKAHPDGTAEIEFHDKAKALVALGTHLGGFVRRQVADDLPPPSVDPVASIGVIEACRRIAFALSRGARLQDAQPKVIEHAEAAE